MFFKLPTPASTIDEQTVVIELNANYSNLAALTPASGQDLLCRSDAPWHTIALNPGDVFPHSQAQEAIFSAGRSCQREFT